MPIIMSDSLQETILEILRERKLEATENGTVFIRSWGKKILSGGEIYSDLTRLDFRWKDKRVICYKHNIVWMAFNGKIPEGHRVWFLDGNKQNLRLDNLFLDLITSRTKPRPRTYPRGKRSLDWDLARAIRSEKGGKTQDEVAKKYKVGQGTVSRIWRNEIWVE